MLQARSLGSGLGSSHSSAQVPAYPALLLAACGLSSPWLLASAVAALSAQRSLAGIPLSLAAQPSSEAAMVLDGQSRSISSDSTRGQPTQADDSSEPLHVGEVRHNQGQGSSHGARTSEPRPEPSATATADRGLRAGRPAAMPELGRKEATELRLKQGRICRSWAEKKQRSYG